MTVPVKIAIDAGCTHTRVLIVPSKGEAYKLDTLPSINPSARGADGNQTLRDLFGVLHSIVGTGPAVAWLASASADPNCIQVEISRIRHMATECGLRFPIVLSNDVVPLLYGVPSLAGRGVVVVAGTGSGFLGGDGNGRIARAGGCEYLGSDEGSAFDIGMVGLRAAIRSLDGRGLPSKIVNALEAAGGCSVPEFARSLANAPYPKQKLAELAKVILQTYVEGDQVAEHIVRSAVAELVLGVRAVRDRLGIVGHFSIAATGGVFSGCPKFYESFCAEVMREFVSDEKPTVTVERVDDTGVSILNGLSLLVDQTGHPDLPKGLRQEHAWLIEP